MREGEKKLLGQEPDEIGGRSYSMAASTGPLARWPQVSPTASGERLRHDFVCLDARLVVELDGGQHDRDVDAASARTALLERRGFRVLRFWNNEVLADPDGVLETIARALEEQ